MKITRTQLRSIIKEEKANLLKEQYQYDPASELYDIQQHLSDAAMKLMEFADFMGHRDTESNDGRRAIQFDSLSRQVKKISEIVETHVSEIESM